MSHFWARSVAGSAASSLLKPAEGAVLGGVGDECGHVEAAGVEVAGGVVADAEHLHPAFGEFGGADAADIAEALNNGGRTQRCDAAAFGGAHGQMDGAAASGLTPADGAARGDGLAGDDLGDGLALVHGVGVHEPGHHLLVRAHVGGHHVDLGPDEGDHLLHVAAGQRLELTQ